ncbi:DinB family protein [Geodermatophilus sp. SYSU D00691]
MLTPDDLRTAAAWAGRRFALLPDADLAPPAPGWTARRTLDHLVDTMELYAAHVGTRATGRLPPPRDGDPGAGRAELAAQLALPAEELARLLDGMGDDERAFHPSGRADRTGWVGMACTELLVHTRDACGPDPVDAALEPLAAAVVDRVLPWTPPGAGWARLLQATGRAPLGDVPPADADWWWQSAPLAEWDGAPRRRTSPPQWR